MPPVATLLPPPPTMPTLSPSQLEQAYAIARAALDRAELARLYAIIQKEAA